MARNYSYDDAARMYAQSRKYKHVGVKVSGKIWLDYDAAQDVYFHRFVISKSYKTTDVHGNEVWKTATTAERDKYQTKRISVLHKDGRVELRPITGNTNSAIKTHFERYWSVSYQKSPTIKLLGYEFYFMRKPEGRYYSERDYTKLSTVSTFAILENGALKAGEPPMVRTWDKEKQKALNKGIKEARRMLSLRDRLGALKQLDFDAEFEALKKLHNRWVVKQDSEALLAMVTSITDADIHSLIPILWIGWNDWRKPSTVPGIDWLQHFNSTIESHREQLRNATGAVSYVREETPEEPTAEVAAREEADHVIDSETKEGSEAGCAAA
jgi:hypothetical protein